MSALTKIRIFPTGMRLHEWIAFEEGYFREQGLDPDVLWDVYLGQMIGVAAGAFVFDRFTAVPLFAGTAVALPALAWWFARKLRQHTMHDEAKA